MKYCAHFIHHYFVFLFLCVNKIIINSKVIVAIQCLQQIPAFLVATIFPQNFEYLWPYNFITNIKYFSDNDLDTNFLRTCDYNSKVTTIIFVIPVLLTRGDDLKNQSLLIVVPKITVFSNNFCSQSKYNFLQCLNDLNMSKAYDFLCNKFR